jgi:cyclic beta-1,2-glucan synthetase
MYRLMVEELLGLQRAGNRLRLAPHLPPSWPGFTLHYRYRETVYHLAVRRGSHGEPARLSLDGVAHPDNTIMLFDDHVEHWAEITVAGPPA